MNKEYSIYLISKVTNDANSINDVTTITLMNRVSTTWTQHTRLHTQNGRWHVCRRSYNNEHSLASKWVLSKLLVTSQGSTTDNIPIWYIIYGSTW